MELNVKYRDYVLDEFQIQSITEIENGHSLVLSAPTGSGKTLVAEYLIEKVLKTDQRIIYTSPIKALSNQKYRDFSRLYGDKVGILTGDVVVNRDAQALIVTTEVYRNMAIEDPEAIADVAYVIFDEIHFLGDIERGTVWEESIIFSPKTVRFLALSATIPNCDELARWIESVIDHQVKVISHNQRAVPLSFLFSYNKQLLTFKDLRSKLRGKSALTEGPRDRFAKKEGDFRHFDTIKQLRIQDRLPLLYFVFSRALADKLAMDTARKMDFTTQQEKEHIEEMVDNCIEKYQLHNLETAQNLREELIHGVGRHHAGLLPQLKELVEVLFAERILKVLFVTETFAVGVNMPARSVAYDALKKYDGRSFRPMQSLEFTQISGRAGRRGIDKTGWVVVPHLPRDLSLEELQNLVYGDIEPLLSQFDLSFNSVLNLYSGHKSEEVRMILKRNFAQFQANKKLPELTEKVAKMRLEIEQVAPRCPEKKNDFEEFMVFYKKKQAKIDTMNHQLDDIRFGMRGKRSRSYQADIEKQFAISHQELSDQEKTFICGKCRSLSKCTARFYQAARLKKKLDYWRGLLEEQGELQLPLYERKLELLRQLGYIDEKGLLARGELASRIHTEEITVTELYFAGYFHECDEHEINAICLSLIYEHRRRGNNNEQPRSISKLPEKVKSARGFVNSLARQHPFIKPLETRICHVILAWSNGSAFEDMMAMCDIPEGDLIRAFRQVIDLIRQIRDAVKDQSLRDKLLNCLAAINRDIVLATELRD
ncbi:MAG: DEAD/DEAH box helicase [Candidatus Riflebacteria bacterium]|nr:DEAD/DEAH box helicase [Candidatus Riflebacteria bacterium]